MALRPPAGTGLSPKPALGIFVKSGQLRGEVEFLVTPGGPAIGSPVGGPHSLGEIRGAAAVGKASAAARNFLRVPSAPREPMAMALTQAPRTGALVPMGVGVARLFLKKF